MEFINDEIVEEVRRIRHTNAAKFNFNVDRICEDIKKKERADQRRGFKFANLVNRKTKHPT